MRPDVSPGNTWQTQRQASERAFTLIELLVALSILAVLLLGIGITLLRIDQTNIFNHDRALAHKAAQQVLEVIMNEDLTDAVSRNGTKFSVFGMTTCHDENPGSISVQDLEWDGVSSQSYLFTIDITNPANNTNYARVWAVRTAQQ